MSNARKAGFAFATAIALIPGAALAEGPFGHIHVATNRHEYHGSGCPIEVIFTGTINFEMPHPRGFAMNYHWERSDGAKGAVHVVHPSPNERSLVVREPWRVGGHGQRHELSTTLYVNSGNTHLRESSPVVRVECR